MSSTTRRPSAPRGLGKPGRALWRDVVDLYQLSVAEVRLLSQACATVDTLAALENRVDDDGLMTVGSAGQPVLHPAVAEARQQRLALSRLLGQLALPDAEGEIIASPKAARARRAAQQRWRNHEKRRAS